MQGIFGARYRDQMNRVAHQAMGENLHTVSFTLLLQPDEIGPAVLIRQRRQSHDGSRVGSRDGGARQRPFSLPSAYAAVYKLRRALEKGCVRFNVVPTERDVKRSLAAVLRIAREHTGR